MARVSSWGSSFHAAGSSPAVVPATLKQSTQALIRNLLFSGEMVPGQIYSANSLATHLGISNSPVREAMMALSAVGLLEPVRNRGFRVVELTDQDRREVYELRVLVEVAAVREAGSRVLDPAVAQHIEELAQASVDALPHAGEPSLPYLDADHAFHMALVDAVGNSRWSAMVSRLRDESRVNGAYHYLEDGDGLAESAQEHVEIAKAVVEGRADDAERLMLKHLDYARPAEGSGEAAV